jgi:hypothetical protein
VALQVNAVAAFVAKRQVNGHRAFLKIAVSDSHPCVRDHVAFCTLVTFPAIATTKSIALVR